MKLISDYNELSNIVENNKGKLSNYYFMKDKAKKLIEKNKLYYETDEENVFIFEDADSFYRVYFFLDDEERININVDKDVVVEIPYTKKLNEVQKKMESCLLSSGFVLERESSQMSVRAQDAYLYDKSDDSTLEFKYGIYDEIEAYKAMLYGIHNPLFAFLPNDEELKSLIDNKCIVCAYYHNELAGVLNVEPVNNTVWMRHLVLSEKFRGKSIGGRLFGEGHRLHKDSCRMFKCWVDIHNIPSVKLHEKFCYKFDDRKANEYVLRTEARAGGRA